LQTQHARAEAGRAATKAAVRGAYGVMGGGLSRALARCLAGRPVVRMRTGPGRPVDRATYM
jgi:hypothetical protein